MAANATAADTSVRAAVSEAVTRIGGLTGRRVAELGSGSGRCAATIAEFGPAELIAIEQSATLVAMSRDLYPMVHAVNDDYTNLGGFGSFDVVFALAHLLFIHDTSDELIATLRNVRAGMPDYGVLVVEQFDLTDKPRGYGSADLRVHEDTTLVSPHLLQHEFTVFAGAEVVTQKAMSSLVLDRSQLEAVGREASFLITDDWENRTPEGEVSRIYLLRAQKGFNYLSDLPDFLESWLTAAHPRNGTPRSIIIDKHGRARPEGTLAWGQGASLSRHHAEFIDSLEPAIRPLVVELVTGWNFVTYSSCEGHVYAQLPRVQYSESYCGVVAFDNHHDRAVQLLLQECCVDWVSDVVSPQVRTRALLGPTSQQRAVDLLFTRVAPYAEWPCYQRERDRLVTHVCRRLRALRSNDDA